MPQSKRHPARRPAKRPARTVHRNPAAPATPVPAGSPWRRALERWSAGPLVVLHRMPTWLVPALLAVFLVAGLALPFPAAGILLLVPAVFLTWLLLLSWPAVSPSGRLLRLIAVLAVFGAAVARLAGAF
ncbi:MAG: hypothetical protein GC157_14035 [Frankiales bacterium]|nr:hypothetical protein [Frankiales bacterium]